MLNHEILEKVESRAMRERKIDKDQVRRSGRNAGQSFGRLSRLAANHQIGLLLNNATQSVTHHRMIINQEHTTLSYFSIVSGHILGIEGKDAAHNGSSPLVAPLGAEASPGKLGALCHYL